MTGGHARLSVNLSPAEMGQLQEYRHRKGITLTDAVTRAAVLLEFMAAAQERGQISVTEPDGRSRDIEFIGL